VSSTDKPSITELLDWRPYGDETEQALLDWEASKAFWARGEMVACFGADIAKAAPDVGQGRVDAVVSLSAKAAKKAVEG
jgi:hypothetical protein